MRVGKVQVSAALAGQGPAGKRALLARAEPVWLHQTFLHDAGGVGARFLDLASPELAAQAVGDQQRLVCHFHVPVSGDRDGELATTADQVRALLGLVREGRLPSGTPLEVETYTSAAGIAGEVASVLTGLTRM